MEGDEMQPQMKQSHINAGLGSDAWAVWGKHEGTALC